MSIQVPHYTSAAYHTHFITNLDVLSALISQRVSLESRTYSLPAIAECNFQFQREQERRDMSGRQSASPNDLIDRLRGRTDTASYTCAPVRA